MIWNEIYVTTNDGARLFVRFGGQGRPLLLIHGAAVDSEFFSDFAEIMAANYFVILYDRRGCGDSSLGMLEPEETSDPDSNMTGAEFYNIQGDDAAMVFEGVCKESRCDNKAIVLGCSAGGIVAAYFAKNHPEMIERLFLHEPPLYSLYTENNETWNSIDDIVSCINIKKYNRALNKFLFFHASHSGEAKKPMTETEMNNFQKNAMTFVKKEFLKAFSRDLVLDGLENVNVSVLYGIEVGDRPLKVVAERIAANIGCKLYPVPGAHNGARDDAKEFADAFNRILDNN